VQTFVSTTSGRVSDFVESIRHYQNVEEENRFLREELSQQELLKIQLKELRQENYRLRELLEFKAQTTYELLPAEVIARNPNQWFEMLTVDKGSRQGVQQGMPVVTNQGLVGSIFTVAPNSSQVLLLTDPRRGVSAMVQRSRDPGVVSPGPWRVRRTIRDTWS
jgi:rod shape-determining protein MreC